MRLLTVGAVAVASALGLLAPQVQGDQWDKKTIVTFSTPIEVPGRVLAAGTYIFKLLDSPSNRHIVEIYNQDETKLQTMILAVPDERLEPKGKTVITFEERPTG